MTTDTVQKRKPEEVESADAPDAKKVKVDPTIVDPLVIKKQIEYYLSDANLAGDKFFFDKIKENEKGFLPMDAIMACNKIKTLRVTAEQIFDAIKESSEVEGDKENNQVRRKDNKALPEFTGIRPGQKPRQQKNHNLNTASGGVVLEVKNIPESVEWGAIKGALREAMNNSEFNKEVNGKKLNHCTTKRDNGIHLAVLPFADNIKYFKEECSTVTVQEPEDEENKDAERKSHVLKIEVHTGSVMEAIVKTFHQRCRDDLRKAQRNFTHQLAKNRKQMRLANQNFDTVQNIKKKVREILAARGNGEELKNGGSDFNLIKSILEYHPAAPKKMANMKGIKVDESSFGGTRCFFVVREDGSSEDFSVTKALVALEANPPYLERADSKATSNGTTAKSNGAATPAKEGAHGESPKSEEKTESTPEKAEEKKEEAAEKKEDEKKEA